MNFLEESMLKVYFMTTSMLGETEKGKLFGVLAHIYAVPDERAKHLYELASCDKVRSITSDKTYFRQKRVMQFCAEANIAYDVGLDIDEVIRVKGQELVELTEHKLLHKETSLPVACMRFVEIAESGYVPVLNALGIMQCEGIIFAQNTTQGLKNILKAAKWDSFDGLMAALYYEKGKRNYLSRVKAKLYAAAHLNAFYELESIYGECKTAPNFEAEILNKAFGAGILRRDEYSGQYARILFSKTVSQRDKERIILSNNQEAIAELSNLPLGIKTGKYIVYDESRLDLPLDRSSDAEIIRSCLSNADICGKTQYKPLCLCSDSSYLGDAYIKAIVDCITVGNVERFEVSELRTYDLEPTKNNILLRSCSEDKPNLFIFSFRGEVSEAVFDLVVDFLRSGRRSKFHLNMPSVCLDLSDVLTFCVCDKKNAKALEDYCDVRRLDSVTDREKKELFARMIEDKKIEYGVEIEYDDALLDKMTGRTVDEMERVLDDIIRDKRRSDDPVLSEELVEHYLERMKAGTNTFGFGGGHETI